MLPITQKIKDLRIGEQPKVAQDRFVSAIQIDRIIAKIFQLFKKCIKIESAFAVGILQKIFNEFLHLVRRLDAGGIRLLCQQKLRNQDEEEQKFLHCVKIENLKKSS